MRTTRLIAVLAVATLLAACGGGGSDGVDENGAAIEASGDQSFSSGDEPPDDLESLTEMSTVTVFVELPPDATTGTAIVAVEDVTYVDEPAIELGRAEVPVTELAAQEGRVDIELPVPFANELQLNASVHLDADSDGTVSTGDWISAELVLLTPFTGSTVSVAVVPV